MLGSRRFAGFLVPLGSSSESLSKRSTLFAVSNANRGAFSLTLYDFACRNLRIALLLFAAHAEVPIEILD